MKRTIGAESRAALSSPNQRISDVGRGRRSAGNQLGSAPTGQAWWGASRREPLDIAEGRRRLSEGRHRATRHRLSDSHGHSLKKSTIKDELPLGPVRLAASGGPSTVAPACYIGGCLLRWRGGVLQETREEHSHACKTRSPALLLLLPISTLLAIRRTWEETRLESESDDDWPLTSHAQIQVRR